MQLLADRLVALQHLAPVSDETVRRVLKKTTSSRGRKKSGVFLASVRSSSGAWRMFWISTLSLTTRGVRKSVLTKVQYN
jgi:hypothetical protein